MSASLSSASEEQRLRAMLSEMLPSEFGCLIHPAAEGSSREEVGREVEGLLARWQEITTEAAAAAEAVANGSVTAVPRRLCAAEGRILTRVKECFDHKVCGGDGGGACFDPYGGH